MKHFTAASNLLTGCTPTLSTVFLLDVCMTFGGGFTPLTSISSPVLPRGLGGGGCLRGSVGLSEAFACCLVCGAAFRIGGGVIGGMRRDCGGGDVGEGGRARIRFGGGDVIL